MVDMSGDGVATENPIVVPKGELSAPGDHRAVLASLTIGSETIDMKLVQQLCSGNCAEYTAINTAIIAKILGFQINDSMEAYLNKNQNLKLDSFERDFVLPLLHYSQENHHTVKAEVDDVHNLAAKYNNLYEPLSILNSALLMRDVLSPVGTEFKKGEIASGENMGSDFSAEDFLYTKDYAAFLIGYGDHATSMIKLHDNFLYIDPFSDKVVSEMTKQDAINKVNRALRSPISVVVSNKLVFKE